VIILLKYLAILSFLLLSACGGEDASESAGGSSAAKEGIEYRLDYCGAGFIMKLVPNDSGGYDFVQEIEWVKISNEAEFAAIAGHTSPYGMCGYYRLTDNITITSYKPLGYGDISIAILPPFAPAGKPFAGILDGDNYTVTIPYSSTLFGILDNAEIKNLKIETAPANGNFTPRTGFYGALALYARESKISNVHVKRGSMALATQTAENNYIGGLIGALEDSAIISSSFTADYADIQDNSSENLYFGGFSGLILGKSVIDDSFVVFKGAAARNKHNNLYAGGLAGKVSGLDNLNRALIKNSFVKIDNKIDETDNNSALYSGGIAGAAERTDFLGAQFEAQNLTVHISYIGYVGGIAGYIDSSGIKESFGSADITMRTAAAPPTLSGYIGGAAGWLEGGSVVENSYFTGIFMNFEKVSLNTIHAGVMAGGIAGTVSNSVIDKTYFFSEKGIISDKLKMFSGGIAGYNKSGGSVKNSFAAARHIAGDTASSSVHRVLGGNAQKALLLNNYAGSDMQIIDGGGIINPPPYEWLNSSEGQDGGSISLDGLSPAFYRDILMWDFKNIWFWDGSAYPKLRRAQKPEPAVN
jgi:hypothetical protein